MTSSPTKVRGFVADRCSATPDGFLPFSDPSIREVYSYRSRGLEGEVLITLEESLG